MISFGKFSEKEHWFYGRQIPSTENKLLAKCFRFSVRKGAHHWHFHSEKGILEECAKRARWKFLRRARICEYIYINEMFGRNAGERGDISVRIRQRTQREGYFWSDVAGLPTKEEMRVSIPGKEWIVKMRSKSICEGGGSVEGNEDERANSPVTPLILGVILFILEVVEDRNQKHNRKIPFYAS